MTDDASSVPVPMGEMPDQVTIYATSREIKLRERLQQLLKQQADVTEPFQNVVRVTCSKQQLADMSELWTAAFDRPELERIQCRLVTSSVPPPLSELMQTQTLGGFTDWIKGRWLIDLLRAQRLVTYFQPIVRNESPEQVFAYECLIRGVDDAGEVILPNRLLSAARATGLLHALDQSARLTAIADATRERLDTCVFINFNPRFVDAIQYLESTIRAVEESEIPTDRFVFEVVESDEIVDSDKLLSVLDYCRGAGCRVALDDLGAGYSSLNLMAMVKPDFVKLDMDLIRDVDTDLYKSCVASKLLELARELGVATVVEGVETHGEWKWATEHGADFSQGYLFARPEPVPPVPRSSSAWEDRQLDQNECADNAANVSAAWSLS